jgi:hypothetical protein
LGGYKFWEFGACNAGSCDNAVPVVTDFNLLFGLAPGFEPGLVAAQDVRVGFVDGLLQFGIAAIW